VATDYFKNAEAQVARTAALLSRQTRKDYRYTGSLEDAIFGNAGNSTRSAGQSLTASSARILSAMKGLLAAQGADAKGILGMANDRSLGGGLAGVMGQSFNPAAATVAGGLGVGLAQVKAGQDYGDTATGLVKLAQAGVEQARAGAKYQTAQVLAGRQKQDVATIAAQEHDIIMAQLQEQLQEKAQQAQYDLSVRAATKAQADLQAKQGPQAVATVRSMANAVIEAQKFLTGNQAATNQEVLDAVNAALGTANDQYLQQLLPQLIVELRNGGSALNAINTVARQNFADLYSKYGKQWSKVAQTTLKVYEATPRNTPGQGGGGEPWGIVQDFAHFVMPWRN
jgi:hypothetical protein